jgi:hypothetical protein
MRFSLIFDFGLRARYIVLRAPIDDCDNEVIVVSPDGDVHAGIAAFVLQKRVQIPVEQVFADVYVTFERAQVEQA